MQLLEQNVIFLELSNLFHRNRLSYLDTVINHTLTQSVLSSHAHIVTTAYQESDYSWHHTEQYEVEVAIAPLKTDSSRKCEEYIPEGNHHFTKNIDCPP